jgi:hypothetical protein
MPDDTEPPDAPSSPPPPPPAAAPPPPPAYIEPTTEWRSLQGLKTALTWLLGLNIVATVFMVVALLNRIGTLDDLEAQESFEAAVRDEDARDLVITALAVFLILALITAIVFIVWFFRAAKNNEALGRLRPRLGPGWAIGGWFIPLANLVIPVLIAQDLWRGSDPSVPRGDDRWRIAPRSALVGWWWALAVLSRFPFFGGQGDTSDAETTISNVRSGINASLVSQVLSIAAAVLAILVVRRLTERQEACLRDQQEAWRNQTGTPPAGISPG